MWPLKSAIRNNTAILKIKTNKHEYQRCGQNGLPMRFHPVYNPETFSMFERRHQHNIEKSQTEIPLTG